MSFLAKLAQSKTVIGVIVSTLPTILPLFGIQFSADEGALITNAIDPIVQALGAIFAVYGRIVAKGPLSE